MVFGVAHRDSGGLVAVTGKGFNLPFEAPLPLERRDNPSGTELPNDGVDRLYGCRSCIRDANRDGATGPTSLSSSPMLRSRPISSRSGR